MISEECHYVGQIVRGQQAQLSPECWVKFFDSCVFFFAKKHFDMCKLWKLWVGSRGNLIPPTREEGRWLAIPRRPWLADCPLNSPPFFCANGEVSLSRHLWKSRCYKSFRYFQWEPQVYTQTIDFERSSRLKFHMTGHCRMERGADLIFQKKTNTKHFYLITTNIKTKQDLSPPKTIQKTHQGLVLLFSTKLPPRSQIRPRNSRSQNSPNRLGLWARRSCTWKKAISGKFIFLQNWAMERKAPLEVQFHHELPWSFNLSCLMAWKMLMLWRCWHVRKW